MPIRTKNGAIPTPRHELAAAMPFVPAAGVLAAAPPNCLHRPQRLSFWHNDQYGDCVTAEEAFAKACHDPEIFISDAEVEQWATSHGFYEGAVIVYVLKAMQQDGFQQDQNAYNDGAYSAVNWTDVATLQSAIAAGPVKIGLAEGQLQAPFQAHYGKSGWIAVGFQHDSNYNHCVSLCGYGTIEWLAQQLNTTVPSGVNGTQQGYAMFTWGSIGIIDVPSFLAITNEAWLRTPTTEVVPSKTRVNGTLAPGQALNPGQSMQSDNKLHTLSMLSDGHVVLYNQQSRGIWWAPNTRESIPPGRFIMQTDGNLVLYDSGGNPRWASNTCNNPGAFLRVQNDGNLVVYRVGSQTETADNALWASGSNDICAAVPAREAECTRVAEAA